jgi:uncharacterized protein
VSPARPLRVEVGDLLDHPNTRRNVSCQVVLDDLDVAGSHLLPGSEVDVDLVLESLPGGVTVTGSVGFGWLGACRRCLEEVTGEARPDLQEIYEVEPTPDETFPIEGSQIDLEPVVREAVLLALPLAPLCRDECRGPAPESFPAHPPGEAPDDPDGTDSGRDPRWAALDGLDFDEGS